jgi:dihydropteroate synthase
MGVLNVTPDSFSDGGRYVDARAWAAAIDRMVADGADIIDIGGESTRPGSTPVSERDQIERVVEPVRYAVAKHSVRVSIDTTRPAVAEAALAAGATIVNDVSCLADSDLAKVTTRARGSLIVMHSRGEMSQMPGFSTMPENAYSDVVAEVRDELRQACDRARAAGLDVAQISVDPGLGFHKNASQSYEVLRSLAVLREVASFIVVGASRKSFLARDVSTPAQDRVGGSIAAAIAAARYGADALRVHDVLETRQAIAVARAAGLFDSRDRPHTDEVTRVG